MLHWCLPTRCGWIPTLSHNWTSAAWWDVHFDGRWEDCWHGDFQCLLLPSCLILIIILKWYRILSMPRRFHPNLMFFVFPRGQAGFCWGCKFSTPDRSFPWPLPHGCTPKSRNLPPKVHLVVNIRSFVVSNGLVQPFEAGSLEACIFRRFPGIGQRNNPTQPNNLQSNLDMSRLHGRKGKMCRFQYSTLKAQSFVFVAICVYIYIYVFIHACIYIYT